jgi:1-pyrroline-5-carboxylate dehydrogenase
MGAPPKNEPMKEYAPSSPERELLLQEISKQTTNPLEIPLIIGGKEAKTGLLETIHAPHNHKLNLATYHKATEKEINSAIQVALSAQKSWRELSVAHRITIFSRAAALLTGKYRYVINAATMLGQSKTAMQAEIDAACELADYWRFNVYFLDEILQQQPITDVNLPHIKNRMEYRPLEGFVLAISPFNFTAICGNLPTAPAIMGNTVVWKPSHGAILSSYYLFKILQEAGLPDGVINFVPGSGKTISQVALHNPHLAGLNFTGSTETFNHLMQTIGNNVGKKLYRNYPRMVGETGGKGFVVAYQDSDVNQLSVALIRGAFEYQGQKCSATSRAYIPASLWPALKETLLRMLQCLHAGDVENATSFMGAVIDEESFARIVAYIEKAKTSKQAQILCGGTYDKTIGYFIEPTIILTEDPHFITMEEEIFGPVLTIYVYDNKRFEETLRLVDETSGYALTGSIFANDRTVIQKMQNVLYHAAGNFYINDKSTGAMVGQQPFGGARASGTNDKAGGIWNLIRWSSVRTIKENYSPPSHL